MLVALVFHSQYSYHYDLFHQLQSQVYIYENKDQSYSPNSVLWLHIFSFECIFIGFITVYSFVLITSCNANPKFLLRLHDSSVLQSIFIFNANLLRINLLFDWLIESSINSHLWLLYSSLYLFVAAAKFVCPNCFWTYLSFSYNVLRLSVITSMPFFHTFLW